MPSPHAELGQSFMFLRAVARSLDRLGGDAAGLLRALGVSPNPSVDGFVPGAHADEVFERVAATMGDATLGLSLAKASPTGSLGVFDYRAITSANLRDAITSLAERFDMLSNRALLELTDRSGEARITASFRCPQPSQTAILADFMMGVIFLRSREALGGALTLRCVRFVHESRDPAAYESLFRARVSFDHPVSELVFDAEILDVPLRTADRTTLALLERHIEQARAAASQAFTDRARAAVRQGLRDESVGIAHLARALGMSTRTLQRRLQDHGTSHRRIIDDVRRELALELLAGDVSLGEAASELGFSRPAAFHRAFTRWTGTTPRAFQGAQERRERVSSPT
jgi:AraC-like DNA-binding protein